MAIRAVGGEGGAMWDHIPVSVEVAEALARQKQEEHEARQRATAHEDSSRYAVTESAGAGKPRNDPFADWNGPTLKLFSWQALEQDRDTPDTQRQDSEAQQRKAAVHQRMMQRSEYRRLASLPANWRVHLDEIEALFPNFAVVVDYLRAMFTVAELNETSAHLDPLLVNGPPGVGRSLFAERLGHFIGSGYRRINMENAQTNAQLAGSDEFWSNSKTGTVFDTLVEGEIGNPVFLLDEVDKVRGRMEFDPLGALYGLLEPATAKSFRDLSMPRIAIDASRIYWPLTSNEVAPVPLPPLNRARRFDMPLPTAEQAVAILTNIHHAVQREVRLPVAMSPHWAASRRAARGNSYVRRSAECCTPDVGRSPATISGYQTTPG